MQGKAIALMPRRRIIPHSTPPRSLRAAIRRGLGSLGGLDPYTLVTLAQNAGFAGADLPVAVAIALAESGGNPNDYNPETAASGGTPQGQGSYGLWQIYLKKHPEFAGVNLYDPQTNANAAYLIYSKAGNSFQPWSTYKYGQYQAFLSQVPGLTPPATPAGPPLTIDASTGQAIATAIDVDALPDATDPAAIAAASAASSSPSFLPGVSNSTLVLTVLGLAAYFLADSLFND